MKKLSGVLVLFAFLFLPVCANATTIDFYTDGTITDGDTYDTVNVWDTAMVNILGGTIAQCILYDDSILNYINGDLTYLVAEENSTVIIHSDYDIGIALYDSSSVYLYNGSSYTQLLIVSSDAVLHIYGYNLNCMDTQGSPYIITGLWQDSGESFSYWVRYAGGVTPQIVLHEIPEPSTLSLFGVLIFFVRKKTQKI